MASCKKNLSMVAVKKMKVPINSIYLATEGEGVFVGTPQVFVRTQGCSIGCFNCDSKDTWKFKTESFLQRDEVLDKIAREGRGIRRASITGGDPLHPDIQPAIYSLIKKLKTEGYFVSLEAAGTCIVDEIFSLLDFINFDYKTPSTKVESNPTLITQMANQYGEKFQIKAVIETREDFEYNLAAYEKVSKTVNPANIPWFLTPAYHGEPFPRERFLQVVSWNENHGGYFRVVGQQHKWLHGANKKQV